MTKIIIIKQNIKLRNILFNLLKKGLLLLKYIKKRNIRNIRLLNNILSFK